MCRKSQISISHCKISERGIFASRESLRAYSIFMPEYAFYAFCQVRQVKNDQFFRNRSYVNISLDRVCIPWSGKCTVSFSSTRKFFRSSLKYSKRSHSILTDGRKVLNSKLIYPDELIIASAIPSSQCLSQSGNVDFLSSNFRFTT